MAAIDGLTIIILLRECIVQELMPLRVNGLLLPEFPPLITSGARLYETNLRALLVYFKHVNAACKSNDPDSCSEVLTYCNVIRQFHDVDEWATKTLLSLCSPEGPNGHSMSHITPEQLKEQLNSPAASLPKSIEGSVAAKILGPVFDGSLIFDPKDTHTDKFNVQSHGSTSIHLPSNLDHVFSWLNTPQAGSVRTGDFGYGYGSAIDLEKAPHDQSPIIPTIMLTKPDGTEADANRPTKNLSKHTQPALDSSRLAPLAPVRESRRDISDPPLTAIAAPEPIGPPSILFGFGIIVLHMEGLFNASVVDEVRLKAPAKAVVVSPKRAMSLNCRIDVYLLQANYEERLSFLRANE